MTLATRRSVVVALLMALAIGSSQSKAAGTRDQAPPAGGVIVKPGDVQWTDYPGRPGVKLAMIEGELSKAGPFLMRVKFPAGYKLAAHTHPGIEHTTILSGALRFGYGAKDDGPSELLPVGSVVVVPSNTPHFASTTEETIVQTHGVGPWSATAVK